MKEATHKLKKKHPSWLARGQTFNKKPNDGRGTVAAGKIEDSTGAMMARETDVTTLNDVEIALIGRGERSLHELDNLWRRL